MALIDTIYSRVWHFLCMRQVRWPKYMTRKWRFQTLHQRQNTGLLSEWDVSNLFHLMNHVVSESHSDSESRWCWFVISCFIIAFASFHSPDSSQHFRESRKVMKEVFRTMLSTSYNRLLTSALITNPKQIWTDKGSCLYQFRFVWGLQKSPRTEREQKS